MTGFRVSEVLSLCVKDILRNGEIVDKIGIAPRNLKGGYQRHRAAVEELLNPIPSQYDHLLESTTDGDSGLKK